MNDLMVTAAFRYCLGRRTYIVGECANWLVQHWNEFRPQTRELIQRELAEAFVHDNKARHEGESFKPLGDDCDRAEWERVRRLPT